MARHNSGAMSAGGLAGLVRGGFFPERAPTRSTSASSRLSDAEGFVVRDVDGGEDLVEALQSCLGVMGSQRIESTACARKGSAHRHRGEGSCHGWLS